MVKSAGLVLSLALKGPAPLASAPWHPAQFSMYSAWPLSASCANAPPIAAIRKAAAHSLTDIGLPIVLMSGRFRNKDLQLPADSLSVFDSNQESTVCYALNGFYEHEKAAKTRPRRIAVLGGDDSKSRIARSRTIFCASICRSGTRSQRRPITMTSSSKCWTVLRRSYFHFLAGERMPARGSMPI